MEQEFSNPFIRPETKRTELEKLFKSVYNNYSKIYIIDNIRFVSRNRIANENVASRRNNSAVAIISYRSLRYRYVSFFFRERSKLTAHNRRRISSGKSQTFSALNRTVILESRFQSPPLFLSVSFPPSHPVYFLTLPPFFFPPRALSDLLLFPTLSAQIS